MKHIWMLCLVGGMSLFLCLPQHVIASPVIKKAFGVNMHLHQRIPEEDQETVLSLADGAGVQWGREEFRWNDIEPVDDEYHFEQYDAIVNSYEQHHIQMLGLLTYSAPWASSQPNNSDAEFYPPDTAAWKDYVIQLAQRYAGRVSAWEIWNEPNHSGFWKGDVDEYVALVTTAAKAIHQQDPDARVVLGGLSGADTVFLDSVLNGLEDLTLIDVVAVHPYRFIDGSSTMYMPEQARTGLQTLESDLHGVAAVMSKHGLKDTPIWLTEIGAANGTAGTGMSQKRQAQYVLRTYTIALAQPQIQKVFWYTMTDSDTVGEDVDGHFGLLQDAAHGYAPKPALSAFHFMKTQLHRKQFVEQRLPTEHAVENFDTQDEWSTAGSVCTNMTLSQPQAGRLTVGYQFTAATNCYAMLSHALNLPVNTQMLQLHLRGSNDDTLLRLRVVDVHGETFQYTLGQMPKRWSSYTLALENTQTYWGGDENGVLDQPLRFDSLIFDDTDGSYASGEVSIDDVLSSTDTNEYLYQFRSQKHLFYAYWNAGGSGKHTITLPGVKELRIARLGHQRINKTAENSIFTLRSNGTIAFLRER